MKYEQLPTEDLESGLKTLGCTPACIAEIMRAVNSHDELAQKLKSADDFIRRAMKILTPDQIGFCGFYRPEAIARAEGK